jgi:hypothetical protein
MGCSLAAVILLRQNRPCHRVKTRHWHTCHLGRQYQINRLDVEVMMIYLILSLLILSVIIAFLARAVWAFGVPGILMVILLLWLIFGNH